MYGFNRPFTTDLALPPINALDTVIMLIVFILFPDPFFRPYSFSNGPLPSSTLYFLFSITHSQSISLAFYLAFISAIMAAQKIVLVTGANQGLGYAVIEVAGLRYPDNVYILCSRNLEKGKVAAAKLRDQGIKARVDVIQLEVTDDEHIAAAVQHVSKTYGRLDGNHF